MGGGDLNLKKSWHPLTKHNLEKVWKAEQYAEKEKSKLDLLRKEKQQERELEELQNLHDQSSDRKKKIEKLDWMYAGSATAAASGVAEEYLLGKRRVDSVLNNRNMIDSSNIHSSVSKKLLTDDKIALDKDLIRKVQEDPMFRIRQQEQALRKKRALLQKSSLPENYDFKLALILSKSVHENIKRDEMSSVCFEKILPPHDAFEIILDRLNLIYC